MNTDRWPALLIVGHHHLLATDTSPAAPAMTAEAA
jgi:hypothetical protein